MGGYTSSRKLAQLERKQDFNNDFEFLPPSLLDHLHVCVDVDDHRGLQVFKCVQVPKFHTMLK